MFTCTFRGEVTEKIGAWRTAPRNLGSVCKVVAKQSPTPREAWDEIRSGTTRGHVTVSLDLDAHTAALSASPNMSGLEIGPSQTDPTTIYDYTFLDFSEKEEFLKILISKSEMNDLRSLQKTFLCSNFL